MRSQVSRPGGPFIIPDESLNKIIHPKFAMIGFPIAGPVYLYPRTWTGKNNEEVLIFDPKKASWLGSATQNPGPPTTPDTPIHSVVGIAPMTVITASAAEVKLYDLTTDASGNIMCQFPRPIVSEESKTLFVNPNDFTFLYLVTSGNHLKKIKIEQPLSTASVSVQTASGKLTYLPQIMADGSLLLWGPESSSLDFFRLTDLVRVNSWPQLSSCSYYLLDNLPEKQLFHTTTTAPALVKLNVDSVSAFAEIVKVPLLGAGQSQLQNLGSLALVALMDVDGADGKLRIFYKSNLVELALGASGFFPGYRGHTFCPGQVETIPGQGNQAYFGWSTTTGAINFQSMLFAAAPTDICQARDGSQICTQCPAGAYMDVANQANNKCYYYGTGWNPVSSQIEGCALLNCSECPATNVCRKCSVAPEVLYLVGNKCYPISSLPSGYGRKVAADLGTALACQVTDCDACQLDNSVCTKCLNTSSKLLYNNACVLPKDLPDGKGPDLINNRVADCSHSDCLDCKISYSTCSKCKVGFEVAQQTCISLPRPTLIKSRFIASELKVELTFDQEIEIMGSDSDILAKAMIVDKLSAAQYSCATTDASTRDQYCKLSISGRVLEVILNPNLDISLGTLAISKPTSGALRSRSSKAEYITYPLLASDIRISQKPTAKTGGNMMQLISNSRSVMNLAMAAVNPAVSGALNRYIATMLYPSYLEGPILVYPQYILANLQSFSLVPWSLLRVPNILQVDTDCVPSEGFDAQEVACALGANMGWDILVILLMCVVSSILSGLAFKLVRKWISELKNDMSRKIQDSNLGDSVVSRDEPTLEKEMTLAAGDKNQLQIPEEESAKIVESFKCGQKAMVWVENSYGLPYLLVQLDSSQLDILTYSLLNIANVSRDSSGYHYFGVVVSILLMAFYLWYAYWTMSYTRSVWQQVQDYRRKNPEKEKVMLEDVVLMEGPLKDLRSFVYEDMRAPEKYYQLLLPQIILIRSAIIVSSLVFVTGRPVVQGLIVIVVEVAYLFFITLANLKTKKVTFAMDVITQVLLLVYLILKQISLNPDVNEESRQDQIGYAMGIILILFAALGLLFTLYSLVADLIIPGIKFTADKLGNCFQKKMDQVHPESSDKFAVTVAQIPGESVVSSKLHSNSGPIEIIQADNKERVRPFTGLEKNQVGLSGVSDTQRSRFVGGPKPQRRFVSSHKPHEQK